jgi:DNA replication protein DnaC
MHQLERADVLTHEHCIGEWDDTFNKPIRNGHERSPATVMYDLLSALPELWDRNKRLLWLSGPPGRGKTFLARMIVGYHCVMRDRVGRIVNWSQHMQELKTSMGADNYGDAPSLAPYYKAQALVLDDVGMDLTYWDACQLYNILEARRLKDLTVITSNQTLRKKYTATVDSDEDGDNIEVTFLPFRFSLFNPSRPADQRDHRYPAKAAQIWDRIKPSHKASWMIADLYVDSKSGESYR